MQLLCMNITHRGIKEVCSKRILQDLSITEQAYCVMGKF